jgi:amino acid adenylation domain-containing protein
MPTEPTTLLGLLTQGASTHPERCAVRDAHGDLSYGALLKIVLELASRLRQVGETTHAPGQEGPGTERIVVALPPGRGAIAACIAATYVGVYVPLDLTHPVERRQSVLATVQPCTLLHAGTTDLDHAQAMTVGMHGPAAGSPLPTSAPGQGRRLPLQAAPCGEMVAYIIHTSGSTGTPKGVLLRHDGLSNVIAEQRRLLALARASRVLQASSMAFDASVFEIALALGAGGTLVVPARSADRIKAAVREVDCAVLTPSLIRQLDEQDTAGLTLLISAGEALAWQDLARISPGCRVTNAYGPTEATIWATLEDLPVIDGRRRSGDVPPSIGRPIRGLDAVIRTEDGLSYHGTAKGELLLAGTGLAAGYHRRPAETDAAFVTLRGRRWYCTGDVIRRDQAGKLHYLHRLDAQVKVAGNRVELGEIESRLRGTAGVAAVAAVAVPDPVTNNRIELFVVPGDGLTTAAAVVRPRSGAGLPHEPSLVSAVRRRAEAVLPHDMRPSRIRLIDAIPLNTSGKVDRAVLRGVAEAAAEQVRNASACAQSSTSAKDMTTPGATSRPVGIIDLIVSLVSEILGLPLDEIDTDEDLVLLGGSSLAFLELADRLGQQLSRRIDVELVVTSASLRDLADRVRHLIGVER